MGLRGFRWFPENIRKICICIFTGKRIHSFHFPKGPAGLQRVANYRVGLSKSKSKSPRTRVSEWEEGT